MRCQRSASAAPRCTGTRRSVSSDSIESRAVAIRERVSCKRALCKPLPWGPDSARIRALCFSIGVRIGALRRSSDRTPPRGGRSLTTCRKRDPELAVVALRDADVAQQAERDHAMVEATSSRLVIRSTSGVPMHSAAVREGVGGAGCARPWPGLVQRDTRPTGRSRMDTAEMDLSLPS